MVAVAVRQVSRSSSRLFENKKSLFRFDCVYRDCKWENFLFLTSLNYVFVFCFYRNCSNCRINNSIEKQCINSFIYQFIFLNFLNKVL